MKQVKKFFTELCPSVYHRYQLLKDLFKDKEYKQIGITLGVLGYPSQYWSALKSIASNIGDILTSDYVKGKNTNDAMSFRDNVLLVLAIASSAPDENDTDEIKNAHSK